MSESIPLGTALRIQVHLVVVHGDVGVVNNAVVEKLASVGRDSGLVQWPVK